MILTCQEEYLDCKYRFTSIIVNDELNPKYVFYLGVFTNTRIVRECKQGVVGECKQVGQSLFHRLDELSKEVWRLLLHIDSRGTLGDTAEDIGKTSLGIFPIHSHPQSHSALPFSFSEFPDK